MSLKSDTYKFRGEIFRRVDKRRAGNLIKEGYPFFLVGNGVKQLDYHCGKNLATPVAKIGSDYTSLEEVEKIKSEMEKVMNSKQGKYLVYYVNAPLEVATYVR